MDWMTILNQVLDICIFPLLGLLTTYLVMFIRKKIGELQEKSHNETIDKYLGLLSTTVVNCVLATKQTYVDALKGQNAFTAEAQKIAFDKTYEAVMASLTEEAKKYLSEVTNDLNVFVKEQIEATVAKTK